MNLVLLIFRTHLLKMAAVQQLSGTIVVIIIAVGVQACIILFIFAKRQIQRFALRNRRGPHMSIGHGKLEFYKSLYWKEHNPHPSIDRIV